MKRAFVKIGSSVLDYGFVSLLGPIGPNLVAGPQTPEYRFILIF